MLKRTFLLLITLIMLAAFVLPAQASGLSKGELYLSALEQLQKYMNEENTMSLEDIVGVFDSLGRYEMSAELSFFAMILRDIEESHFNNVYLMIDMLQRDQAFDETLGKQGLGSLTELRSYARCRQAESNADLAAAMACYEECPGFMDSTKRLFALQMGRLAESYREAQRLYALGTLEGYQQAHALFVELGDYEESAAYAMKAEMLMAALKPTPEPTLPSTATPSPTALTLPSAAPELARTGKQETWNEYTIEVLENGECEIVKYRFPSYNYNSYSYKTTMDLEIPAEINGYRVVSIGEQAFSGRYYSSNYAEGYAPRSLSSVTIPEGVTHIGAYAFADQGFLPQISLPNSLVSIGEGAFFDAGVAYLHLPSGITYLGEKAFIGMSSLLSISVDSNNPYYYAEDYMLFGRDGSLVYCPSWLKIATVPEGVKTIKGGAFPYRKTADITLPQSLEKIEKEAFIGDDLSINIPAGTTEIAAGAFSNCRSCTFVFEEGTKSINWNIFEKSGDTFEIPESVVSMLGFNDTFQYSTHRVVKDSYAHTRAVELKCTKIELKED